MDPVEPTDNNEEQQEAVGVISDTATSFLDTSEPEAPPEPEPGVPERPDYISEAHWDPTKGEVRLEALAKSFTDTKAALDKRKDDSGIPDTALGYLTTKEDGNVFLPEELSFLPELSSSDPVISKLSTAALDAGVSKAQFEQVFTAYLEGQNQFLSQYVFDKDAEMAKIDTDPVRAGYMVEGVRSYVSQLDLSESESQALDSLMTRGEGVTVMSKLMTLAGRNSIPMGAAATHTPDQAALDAEWNDLRKRPQDRDSDPELQKRFDFLGNRKG